MRKFLSKVFSKTTFIVILLLLQIAILVLFFLFLESYPIISTILTIIGALVAFYIVNSKSPSDYKIAWLFFLVFAPVFGALCYIFFANKKFTKKQMKKYAPTVEALNEADKIFNRELPILDEKKDADAINISTYIYNYAHIPLYRNTKATYFSWGQDGFPIMLERLKSAKHYIFMEYFIISEGKMWSEIEKILIEKAKEGVDVRIIFDDLGSLGTFPKKALKKFSEHGIKYVAFNPIRPLIDIRMNNRDHRKILVIDGHTGFTGGINIADEYINEIVRFGVWKDNVLMLEGEGVFGLTILFLSNYKLATKELETSDFMSYLPLIYKNETKPFEDDGFVQPYGSIPFSYETIGANVYVDLLLKAKKYVYIATPYLILDEEMENAIMQAAKNGVKVKILTPHIPDKKAVFALTRSYYYKLIETGVEIYEYTPGFVHSKMFLVDDIMASVGTINLDYRSLYLHFENGVFLYKNSCLKDIKNDFETTFLISKRISLEKAKPNFFQKIIRGILKIISPLM